MLPKRSGGERTIDSVEAVLLDGTLRSNVAHKFSPRSGSMRSCCHRCDVCQPEQEAASRMQKRKHQNASVHATTVSDLLQEPRRLTTTKNQLSSRGSVMDIAVLVELGRTTHAK